MAHDLCEMRPSTQGRGLRGFIIDVSSWGEGCRAKQLQQLELELILPRPKNPNAAPQTPGAAPLLLTTPTPPPHLQQVQQLAFLGGRPNLWTLQPRKQQEHPHTSSHLPVLPHTPYTSTPAAGAAAAAAGASWSPQPEDLTWG